MALPLEEDSFVGGILLRGWQDLVFVRETGGMLYSVVFLFSFFKMKVNSSIECHTLE